MTKAQMIQTMQQREAAAYLEYMNSAELFGESANITRIECNRWSALFETCQALGITSDYELPDAQEAQRIRARLESQRSITA